MYIEDIYPTGELIDNFNESDINGQNDIFSSRNMEVYKKLHEPKPKQTTENYFIKYLKLTNKYFSFSKFYNAVSLEAEKDYGKNKVEDELRKVWEYHYNHAYNEKIRKRIEREEKKELQENISNDDIIRADFNESNNYTSIINSNLPIDVKETVKEEVKKGITPKIEYEIEYEPQDSILRELMSLKLMIARLYEKLEERENKITEEESKNKKKQNKNKK